MQQHEERSSSSSESEEDENQILQLISAQPQNAQTEDLPCFDDYVNQVIQKSVQKSVCNPEFEPLSTAKKQSVKNSPSQFLLGYSSGQKPQNILEQFNECALPQEKTPEPRILDSFQCLEQIPLTIASKKQQTKQIQTSERKRKDACQQTQRTSQFLTPERKQQHATSQTILTSVPRCERVTRLLATPEMFTPLVP